MVKIKTKIATLAQDIIEQNFKDLLSKNNLLFSEQVISKLITYGNLVEKWNEKAGLVSRNDSKRIFSRHIAESIFMSKYFPCPYGNNRILDMGAGAGFPGIPLKVVKPDYKLFLIESNKKKCLFLNHALSELGLDGVVINERLESKVVHDKYSSYFDIITARALAVLPKLLGWAKPLLSANSVTPGKCIFPKGTWIINELEDTDENIWNIKHKEVSHWPKERNGTNKALHIVTCLLSTT